MIFFFKLILSFSNELIKSDSKNFYTLTKTIFKRKCCSIEISMHQRIKKKISSTTIFNIDNEKCYIIE